MTLSRRYLEAGGMRELYLSAVDDRALTDEQLSASLTATHSPSWILPTSSTAFA